MHVLIVLILAMVAAVTGGCAQPSAEHRPPAQQARVTLEFKNTDVHEAISQIARAAGASIMVMPELKGAVTFKIADVEWKVALNRVVQLAGGAVILEQYDIARVVTADEAVKWKALHPAEAELKLMK